jgi:hypothetical protein
MGPVEAGGGVAAAAGCGVASACARRGRRKVPVGSWRRRLAGVGRQEGTPWWIRRLPTLRARAGSAESTRARYFAISAWLTAERGGSVDGTSRTMERSGQQPQNGPRLVRRSQIRRGANPRRSRFMLDCDSRPGAGALGLPCWRRCAHQRRLSSLHVRPSVGTWSSATSRRCNANGHTRSNTRQAQLVGVAAALGAPLQRAAYPQRPRQPNSAYSRSGGHWAQQLGLGWIALGVALWNAAQQRDAAGAPPR